MKKFLATALAGLLCLSLAACGGSAGSAPAAAPASSAPAASQPQEAPAGQTYKVGICQLVTHDALDAATQGFKDALEEALPGQVEFDEQNAANEPANCITIVNAFVNDPDMDLIMANATPALQAAAAATADIPVLGTSVTEYGVALNLTNFDGTVGTNVSGTSDLAPLDQQAAMIQELFPQAQKVALLYCSGEPNSKYQVETVAAVLDTAGLETKMFAFTDSNDVSAVSQSACDYADVLYIPTDNTAASNTGIIGDNCLAAGVPVVAGEEGLCRGCGVATLSISYYDLGVATGRMAAQILTGEADISQMPIEYAPRFVKKYNAEMAKELNVEIPADYEAIQ